MRKAIYAFSGDPITVGHINLIERAAQLFDELVVAIGVNPTKHYLFTLVEREAMARSSLAHLPNVKVASFEGLVVDYAYEIGATVLVRGVRTDADMEYERNLFWLGDSQHKGIDTVILMAKQELAHVSSSAVKEIQAVQGLVHHYVSLPVKQALERKISGQFLIGVTGEAGVGKNYICEQLVKIAQDRHQPAHHIDLDVLGHQILQDTQAVGFQQVRTQVLAMFGQDILDDDQLISRAKLAEIVFSDTQKRQYFNDLMVEPLLVQLRKALFGKKGLIILNGALLAEFGWLELVNNHVILVSASPDQQRSWLHQRGWSSHEIEQRLTAQASTEVKRDLIQSRIEADQYGFLLEVTNQSGHDTVVSELYTQIESQILELQ